jgi:hypothetical protein
VVCQPAAVSQRTHYLKKAFTSPSGWPEEQTSVRAFRVIGWKSWFVGDLEDVGFLHMQMRMCGY